MATEVLRLLNKLVTECETVSRQYEAMLITLNALLAEATCEADRVFITSQRQLINTQSQANLYRLQGLHDVITVTEAAAAAAKKKDEAATKKKPAAGPALDTPSAKCPRTQYTKEENEIIEAFCKDFLDPDPDDLNKLKARFRDKGVYFEAERDARKWYAKLSAVRNKIKRIA